MDGRFVPTRSPSVHHLLKVRIPSRHEVHLMVRHVEPWRACLRAWKTRTVIVPVEVYHSPTEARRAIGGRVRLIPSINPSTPISALQHWLPTTRRVHVMTVRPGRYGAPFLPKALSHVRFLHRKYPRLLISVDGGVSEQTIRAIVNAGTRILIVGSAVALDPSPRQALEKLQRLLS